MCAEPPSAMPKVMRQSRQQALIAALRQSELPQLQQAEPQTENADHEQSETDNDADQPAAA